MFLLRMLGLKKIICGQLYKMLKTPDLRHRQVGIPEYLILYSKYVFCMLCLFTEN
jgi:hypothetical protein